MARFAGVGVPYWRVRVTSIPARFLLAIGALAASVGFWAFSAERTILDPAATRELAGALVDTSAVTDSLARQLSGDLADRLPDDVAPSVPPGAVDRIATTVVADPRVAAAFARTIGSLHEQLLAGTAGDDIAIDTRAINAALADAIAAIDPDLAQQLGDAEPVELRIDSSRLPDLQPIDDGATNVMLAAALLAVLAFGLAVAIHPEPWRAVSIVGRRLAAIGIVPVVLYVVVPAALRGLGSSWSETMAPFASAYGNRILPGALALMIGGVALWIGGLVGVRTGPALPAMEPRGVATEPRRRSRPADSVSVGPGRTDLRL